MISSSVSATAKATIFALAMICRSGNDRSKLSRFVASSNTTSGRNSAMSVADTDRSDEPTNSTLGCCERASTYPSRKSRTSLRTKSRVRLGRESRLDISGTETSVADCSLIPISVFPFWLLALPDKCDLLHTEKNCLRIPPYAAGDATGLGWQQKRINRRWIAGYEADRGPPPIRILSPSGYGASVLSRSRRPTNAKNPT